MGKKEKAEAKGKEAPKKGGDKGGGGKGSDKAGGGKPPQKGKGGGQAAPSKSGDNNNSNSKGKGGQKGGKGAGGAAGGGAGAAPVDKKKSKKERQEAEAARRREAEEMLMIPSSSEEEEEEEEDEAENAVESGGAGATDEPPKGPTRDEPVVGTAAGVEAMKLSDGGDKETATGSREAEKLERDTGTCTSSSSSSGPKKPSPYQIALAKSERGEKLSNKERRALQKGPIGDDTPDDNTLSGDVEAARVRRLEEAGLSMFQLNMRKQQKRKRADIFVEDFDLSIGKNFLLKSADLKVSLRRRYGLLGPNGCGKTVLLRHIAARAFDMPEHMDVFMVEQEVKVDGRNALQFVLDCDQRRTLLQAREAELTKLLESDTTDEDDLNVISDQLAEVCEQLQHISADKAEHKAKLILKGLGFTADTIDRPCSHLSGGWKMRLSLARALFLRPSLLLMDEPTNHLDLNAVIWLSDFMSTWTATLVVVSHDVDFLETVCTDIVHLEYRTLLYYHGSYNQYLKMHEQELARRRNKYNNQQRKLKELKSKGMSAAKAEAAVCNEGEVLLEAAREYHVNLPFTTDEDSLKTEWGVKLNNVDFGYGADSGNLLFRGLDITAATHTKVVMVGPNGVGKSSALKLLARRLQPTSGEVESSPRLRLGEYHQHFDELLRMGQTPVEFLTSEYSVKEQEARKTLGQVGLDGSVHMKIMGSLSGGQKARVVFASLLLKKPHLLLMDEPTNHLDIESVEALIDGLNAFKGGLVLISHDTRLVERTGCQLWLCDNGKVTPSTQTFDQYRKALLSHLSS